MPNVESHNWLKEIIKTERTNSRKINDKVQDIIELVAGNKISTAIYYDPKKLDQTKLRDLLKRGIAEKLAVQQGAKPPEETAVKWTSLLKKPLRGGVVISPSVSFSPDQLSRDLDCFSTALGEQCTLAAQKISAAKSRGQTR